MTTEQMIQTDKISIDEIVKPAERSAQYKSPPVGEPGVLEWIPVRALEVDAEYQREHRSAHARKIAREWDWSKVKAINVCIRDSSYYVTDGQHLTIGAKLRGDIRRLPAYVMLDTTQEQEADIFLGINSQRKNVTAYERHRAALVAGHADAVQINKILDKHGIELTPKHTDKDRECSSISTCYTIENSWKKIGGLDELLTVIAKAWWYNNSALKGTFMVALAQVMNAARDNISNDDLIRRLKKLEPELVLQDASSEFKLMSGSVPMARVLALKIAAHHDKLYRDKKLCPMLASS